jgi:hypothetical protein
MSSSCAVTFAMIVGMCAKCRRKDQSNLATFRIANDEFHVQAAGGAGIQLHQFAMQSFQRAP